MKWYTSIIIIGAIMSLGILLAVIGMGATSFIRFMGG